MPSQKNLVSGEMTGRITGPAAVPPRDPGGWAGGRNFRIRKSMVATTSSPLDQVLRVVKNQPSPSAVRLGPVSPARLTRSASFSPCRR